MFVPNFEQTLPERSEKFWEHPLLAGIFLFVCHMLFVGYLYSDNNKTVL